LAVKVGLLDMSTELSTDHSRIYEDFVRDLRFCGSYPFVYYPSEYNGQEVIKLCCSQHKGFISEKKQKKITASWADFLSEKALPLKEVQACTKLNQSVFDALCTQKALESLRIKWFLGKSVKQISNLRNLKKLFIENGSAIEDISPISKLKNLEVLILGETVRVEDYSCLSELTSLKVLGICAYQTHCNTKIKMKSTEFIKTMDSLEYVDIQDVVEES
jgi:Leucine-rich repeat (LRR) protein